MNHVYKVVFNRALGVYQCVSEIAKSQGKSSGKSASSNSKSAFNLTTLSVAMLMASTVSFAAEKTINDGLTQKFDDNVLINGSVLITEPNTAIIAPNHQINFGGNLEDSLLTIDTDVVISNSAKIEAGVSSSIGIDRFAKVTVDNAEFNSTDVAVGAKANGQLVLTNNSNMNVGDELFIGYLENTVGELDVNGGSKITTNSLALAESKSAIGKLNLKGSNSQINVSELASVGSVGSGELTIEQGGMLNSKIFAIANEVDSEPSEVIVDGENSKLTALEALYAGISGDGSLIIQNGGEVVTKNISVGDRPQATGTINISGKNSRLTADGINFIGRAGKGEVDVSNSASWIGGDIYIGDVNGDGEPIVGNGTLTVRDSGSKVNARDLFVGSKGTGNTTIENGATANIQRITQIGGSDNSTLSVNAKGTLTVDNATLNTPITLVGAFGSGNLNVENNGVLKTSGIERFSNSKGSAISLDKGTIELTDIQPELFRNFTGNNPIELKSGGGTINTAGFNARLFENTTLPSKGAVITGSGDFTKAGKGLLAMPVSAKQWTGSTNINQGTLRLDGNYTMRDGEVLGIGLNSLKDYGQLEVKGTADISKGTLNVKASDAVNALTDSNEWKNIVTATTRTGEFASVTDNNLLIDFEADYSDPNAVHLRMISQAEADAKAAAEKAAADKAAADKAAADKAAADKAAADKAAADKAAADKAAADKAAADKAAADKAAADKAAADKAAADKAAADKAAADKAAADKAAADKAAADKAAADKAAADKAAADKAAADKAAADKAAADKAAADKAAADKAAADKAAADKAAADKAAADKVAADKAAADKAAADKAAADKAAADKAAADKAAADKLKAEQDKGQPSNAFVKATNSVNNQSATGLATVLDQVIDDQLDTKTSENQLAKQLISDLDGLDQEQVADAAAQLQPLFMGGANRLITDTNYAAGRAIEEHSQTTPERNLWAKAIGSDMTHDADGYVTGYNSENYGAIVGLDMPVNPNLNLGIAVSYIESDADTDGHALNHELEAKNWQVLGYGNYAASEATSVNFHAGAGQSNVKGERHISGITSAVAKSDYDVDTLQAGLGVAHRIGSQTRNVSPFANVSYARAKSEGYRETGAGVYNLAVDSNTYDSLRWTAGIRFDQALTPTFSVTGQLAGAIENGDRYSDITASFVEVGSNKFMTQGQKSKEAIGIAGIGLAFKPTANTTISANYRGEWRDNYDDQGASIVFETKF